LIYCNTYFYLLKGYKGGKNKK